MIDRHAVRGVAAEKFNTETIANQVITALDAARRV
jgi:hypothetical protein